jgi:hypothetical protein
MLLPADCITLCPAPGAAGNDGGSFTIRLSVLDAVQEHGPIWKYESLRLIPGVLQSPIKIYEGLGRPDCLAACCYLGRPDICYDDDGKPAPAPKNCFFVVYLEPLSGGNYRVWDWGWRLEDENSPGKPVGWQTFERGEIWPPN